MYLQLNKCDYIFYINNYDDSIKVNSKIELIDCETKTKHIGTVRKIENDLAQFL
jgi:mRNA deadenylase 3'-5' endonuclease subunit Ccr4